MRRTVALLFLLLACRASPPVIAAQADKPIPLRMLGEANPGSMPPSCRVHGGTPPVRSGPVLWARSTHRDRRLDSLGLGRVSIRLVSARTGESIQSAAIYLEPTAPVVQSQAIRRKARRACKHPVAATRSVFGRSGSEKRCSIPSIFDVDSRIRFDSQLVSSGFVVCDVCDRHRWAGGLTCVATDGRSKRCG